MQDVLRHVRKGQDRGNPGLALLGIVVVQVPAPITRLADYLIRYIDQNLRRKDGQSLRFETFVSQAVAIQEAAKVKSTTFQYEPDHKTAKQYLQLAREVEQRIVDLRAEETLASAKYAEVANA